MKPTITYFDFEQLDFRVGRIVAAEAPEWSQKLLQFTVDFGPEIGERTIMSGIKQWYEPDFFVGKYFPFLVNLAERKMGEGISQGMMIMVDGPERPVVTPIAEDANVQPGLVIR